MKLTTLNIIASSAKTGGDSQVKCSWAVSGATRWATAVFICLTTIPPTALGGQIPQIPRFTPPPPGVAQVLQHRIVDALPTSGEGEKPITLSGAEKKHGLKFLVVDVALPADESATYPGTQPIISDANLDYVRPCVESKAFRYVLNASSFTLQLPGEKTTTGMFIKWSESESWCAPRDTVIHLVQGGEDACIFHSARSLVVATNRNPATLKATLAFTVPGRVTSLGTPTIRYEPPPASDITAALATPTPEGTAAMPPAPGLDLQAKADASDAASGMNVPRSSDAPPARAAHPSFQEPMPDGPNTITVENHCHTWLGLGILCDKIGSEFQYGSILGVPAGKDITLTVPNGTFHVYWIRQDRPASRFRLPDPVSLSGGNDRIQKYLTLAIGSNIGENAIEEEF